MGQKRLFSDKVRQFACGTFKGLAVGERFRFASEVEFPLSGMKRGVAVKLSARKYRYEDGEENEVGSVHVVILKVDDSGDLIRIGHWSPYLED